jgi:hypothetical protein
VSCGHHTLLGDFAGLAGAAPYPAGVRHLRRPGLRGQAGEQGDRRAGCPATSSARSALAGRPRILTTDGFATVTDPAQRQRLRDAVRRSPLLG